MTEISRTALFGKLNSLGYKSVESATVFCKMRGNPYVELVHWLNQILQLPDSDLHRILRHFEIDSSRIAADMTAALDQLPRGSTSISDLSPHLEESAEVAWTYATLLYGESQIRTGHVLVALLKTARLKNVLKAISKEFDRIKKSTLTQITQRYGQPNAVASRVFNKLIYGEDHILSNSSMGSSESVSTITIDDLKTYYDKNYCFEKQVIFRVSNSSHKHNSTVKSRNNFLAEE